jgi:ATP-dependent Zn protease
MVENPQNQQNNEVNENKSNDVILNTSNEHNSSGISIDEIAKNVQIKREKNKNLRIFLFSIVGVIIILVSLFLVFGFLNKKTEYTSTEEQSLYQYFAGNKEEYTGKFTISSNNDVLGN